MEGYKAFAWNDHTFHYTTFHHNPSMSIPKCISIQPFGHSEDADIPMLVAELCEDAVGLPWLPRRKHPFFCTRKGKTNFNYLGETNVNNKYFWRTWTYLYPPSEAFFNCNWKGFRGIFYNSAFLAWEVHGYQGILWYTSLEKKKNHIFLPWKCIWSYLSVLCWQYVSTLGCSSKGG